MKTPFYHQVAVLGAGTVGAQIAAHFANANIPVRLFDLPGKTYPDEIAEMAIKNLITLNPDPLAMKSCAETIIPCNYRDDVSRLAECDLVVEAITENKDIKASLYQKIVPHLHDNAILASNTSGLSINTLAKALPTKLRKRFMGVHFFNPPRYLPLVELIANRMTDGKVLEEVETFLTTVLGKNDSSC